MPKFSFSAICCLVLATVACSPAPIRPAAPRRQSVAAAAKADHSNSRTIVEALYQQHRQWQGTPYRYGGLNRNGVDCSGFVYLTYLERFGIKLPRSTKGQAGFGNEVRRSELRPGDLVFFKTGTKSRHVGIYIEKGKFLHASTKNGVMISSFQDYYWKDKFRYARRVGL